MEEKGLLLTGGKVYKGGNFEELDLLVKGGVITGLDKRISPEPHWEVVDVTGKIVCPGFVDIHCHLRTPGQEYKEDIKTGTMAAVRGGFTRVFTMANTEPVIDELEIVESLLERIKNEAHCHVEVIGAVTKGLKGKELVDFEKLAPKVIAFSDDGKGIQRGEIMGQGLKRCKGLGKIIISHCEFEGELPESEKEWRMVERDINLAKFWDASIHIAHVSTRESVKIIEKAKEKGVKVTAEACPHHFLLTKAEILNCGTNGKVNPPLKGERDRKKVLEGVKRGIIDCLATDHAPHSQREKNLPFKYAAMGMVGLETAVPLTLNLVNIGAIKLERVIEAFGEKPYEIFGISGGKIEEGFKGNLTVLDLEKEFVIDKDQFFSKGRNTPFNGWKGKGDVYMTIVDGKIKYRGAEENVY
ncbi:dihydroorotase [Anaerobranca californiensis DSM 14826]|jgi:dihydroorotase|uniref:Dihydroorotase n=1 Tax=Anaerobranca californiensis DSM 14826 TaxID=1120989 RepID=A0A1M6LGM9_9FIRM|nr:dihydroorotase [Anaerobranca californiensis]SHJ70374.1 dihydroorotase [Anaerobranca californiensis DSM 14826]